MKGKITEPTFIPARYSILVSFTLAFLILVIPVSADYSNWFPDYNSNQQNKEGLGIWFQHVENISGLTEITYEPKLDDYNFWYQTGPISFTLSGIHGEGTGPSGTWQGYHSSSGQDSIRITFDSPVNAANIGTTGNHWYAMTTDLTKWGEYEDMSANPCWQHIMPHTGSWPGTLQINATEPRAFITGATGTYGIFAGVHHSFGSSGTYGAWQNSTLQESEEEPEPSLGIATSGKTTCTGSTLWLTCYNMSQFILKNYYWSVFSNETGYINSGNLLTYSNNFQTSVNLNTTGEYGFGFTVTYLGEDYTGFTYFNVTDCNMTTFPLSNITMIPTPNYTHFNFTPVNLEAPNFTKEYIMNMTNSSIIPNEWLGSVIDMWDSILNPTNTAIEGYIDLLLYPLTFLSESMTNFRIATESSFSGVQSYLEFWILIYQGIFQIIPTAIQLGISFGLCLVGIKIFIGWRD